MTPLTSGYKEKETFFLWTRLTEGRKLYGEGNYTRYYTRPKTQRKIGIENEVCWRQKTMAKDCWWSGQPMDRGRLNNNNTVHAYLPNQMYTPVKVFYQVSRAMELTKGNKHKQQHVYDVLWEWEETVTMKLSRPVSIVDTDHAGFHVSGWKSLIDRHNLQREQ